MKTTARPIGVTIIAILDIISAVLLILAGALFFVLAQTFAVFLGSSPFTTMLGPLASFMFVILLISGGISLLIGWGLLKGKNWARWVTIIFSALGIIGAALSLLLVSISLQMGLITALPGIIVNALWIYVLMRPSAKAFFTGQISPVSATVATARGATASTPSTAPQQLFCSDCGKRLTYVPQYQRYYCYNCKKYA